MKPLTWIVLGAIVLLALGGAIWFDPTCVLWGTLRGEAFFEGRPVSYWRKQLTSDEPAGQRQATRQLLAGQAAAVPVLVALLQDRDGSAWKAAEVRWKAADLLRQLGAEAEIAGSALIAALNDEDLHVRTVAATALAALQPPPPEAISPLLEMLPAGDRASLAATRTLSVYRAEALPALPVLRQLLQVADPELRWTAARTIGKIGPQAHEATADLIALLREEHPKIREHAAESLGEIGPQAASAVPALIERLGDTDSRVRRDAARSLGQIGSAAMGAIEPIQPLLKDKDPTVRQAAAQALRRLQDARKKEAMP